MNHPSRYASRGASKVAGGATMDKGGKAGKSLNMQAYELVKHRILTLQFPPGACLNEANLSQQLNIGRTPIHQALNRLTLEGMVQVIPRKGIIVKSISMDEVMENIEIRLVNEMCCARLAALRRDERDIAEMKRILAVARQELPTQNIERQMILDHDFHLAISAAAKNRMLTDILSHLHDQSLRFWFISLREREHHASVQDEHQAVLEAIIAQDADAASEMTRNHIESFRRNVVRLL